MLKLQEKLFFSSIVRNLLAALLVIGGVIYHIWIFARTGAIDDIRKYGYLENFTWQIYVFVFYFVILIFMAYDYFREVPDAGVLEIIKINDGYFKADCLQALVMFQWVALSAVLVLGFATVGFAIAETLTWQVFTYLCKLIFLYIILNGIVAILLSWLLSKTVGRLVGYICVILFTCCVSPMLTSELEFLSMLFRQIYGYFKVFLIMPEGLHTRNEFTLYPVNFSLISRSLFWIFIFLLGLMFGYKIQYKKRVMVCLTLLLCGMVIYMNMPYSFYSSNNSLGESDSILYDQTVYEVDKQMFSKEETGFAVKRYQMDLYIGRIMRASVLVVPENDTLSEYKMTLYHLYKIKKVTDGEGNPMSYDREGDYVSIVNPGGRLESIYIEYEGCLANFYTNRESINLPGWFAYYPIPGYRPIYLDYQYVDNRLNEEVDFDITVHTKSTVYSDVSRVEKNHFMGKSYGATLVSGFVREADLGDGIRCVYPYLEKISVPVSEIAKEDCNYTIEQLKDKWTEEREKTIMILPSLSGTSSESIRDYSVTGYFTWKVFAKNLRETGSLIGVPPMEEDVKTELFLSYYNLLKQSLSEQVTYDELKSEWDVLLGEDGPSTEEEFEKFLVEVLGQDEYDHIVEGR